MDSETMGFWNLETTILCGESEPWLSLQCCGGGVIGYSLEGPGRGGRVGADKPIAILRHIHGSMPHVAHFPEWSLP